MHRTWFALPIAFLLPLRVTAAQSPRAGGFVDRWWVAAGIGGLQAPFDEHLVSLAGELGVAHRHFAIVSNLAMGIQGAAGERGSSERHAWAVMAGPSLSRHHFNAHLAAGPGRLASCVAPTDAEVCTTTTRFVPAINAGFDVNVHDAFGLQVRQAWLGTGRDSYHPLTFGIIIGRLATDPVWDRR